VIRRVKTSVLVIAAAAACLSLAGCHSHHIDSTIENRTGAPVELLEVDYPSASFGDNRLEAGAVFHYRFQVRGSGPLTVEYTDSSGRQIHINGPTLVEGQQGQIRVVLEPDGKAEFLPQISARP
jgi:hypothetical protein